MKNTISSSGFTLIELLVALGIIALLAAIVFPAFAVARNHSKTSVCLSNVRQLGLAVSAYVSDNDDHLPFAPSRRTKMSIASGDTVYGEPLDGQLKQTPDIQTVLKRYGASPELFHCPMDHPSPIAASALSGQSWFSYCGSSYDWNEQGAINGATLSGHSNPGKYVLFYDYEGFHGEFFKPGKAYNGVFADGHALSFSGADLADYKTTTP